MPLSFIPLRSFWLYEHFIATMERVFSYNSVRYCHLIVSHCLVSHCHRLFVLISTWLHLLCHQLPVLTYLHGYLCCVSLFLTYVDVSTIVSWSLSFVYLATREKLHMYNYIMKALKCITLSVTYCILHCTDTLYHHTFVSIPHIICGR